MITSSRRFKITQEGRQLAIVTARTPEDAKASLLAERGYGYLTPEVLEAEDLGYGSWTEAVLDISPPDRPRFVGVEWRGGRCFPLLAKAAAVLLLALALPFAAHAAEKAPRHITRPISTITVKVVSQADFTRGKLTKDLKPWRITTADADSCTAWVRADAKDVIGAELLAFKACRVRLAVQAQAVRKDGAR